MTTPRKDAPPAPREAPAAARAADPWLSVGEAARRLGIHPQTVKGRAAAGLLVSQVVGRRLFVHRDSVEALAAETAVA